MQFDEECERLECEHLHLWHHIVNIGGATATDLEYTSKIDCASCKLHDIDAEQIDKIPHNCVNLRHLVDYEVYYKIKRQQYEKKWEQEQIWKKLTYVS